MEGSVAGSKLNLNRKEFAVLRELLAADGAVVSGDQLRERVWERDAGAAGATVRVTVHRLRQKLGDPTLIETVPHVGYRVR
jgi:DNA-binding response OmpR family regulator